MLKIFKWLTKEGGQQNFRAYAYWFVESFNPNVFTGIERILFYALREAVDVDADMSENFLSVWLKTSGKEVIKKNSIKPEMAMSYDYNQPTQFEEAYRAIVDATLLQYSMFMDQDLSGREFPTDVYEYIKTQASNAYQQALADAFPKFTDGSNPAEVGDDLATKLNLIQETFSVDKLEDLDIITKRFSTGRQVMTLCQTGIPVIDADCGGVKTSKIYTVNAQPAGGKTRFVMSSFAYKVLTEAHKDVLCYELELSKEATENILISHHIYHLFKGTVKMPDSLMEDLSSLTKEQQEIYQIAKADLFESGKYGQFIVKSECTVEKLKNSVKSCIKTHPNFGLLIIDYMGLIESVPEKGKYVPTLEGFEIITEAYKIVRRLLLRYDFTAVCINQYNDKGIEAAFQGKTIRSGFIQGGHITHRHTDYDINLTYTEEQQMRHARSLSLGKTRFTSGFPSTLLGVDLSISLFKQGG